MQRPCGRREDSKEKRSESLAGQTAPKKGERSIMQSVWTLRGPGPDHAGPSVFTLYLVGSEKPLEGFNGVEGSWAGFHCEILPALTVGGAGAGGKEAAATVSASWTADETRVAVEMESRAV